MKRPLAIGLLCAVAALAGGAAAEPSVWQMAAEPRLKTLEDALAHADQLLDEYVTMGELPAAMQRSPLLHQARTVLEALPPESRADWRVQRRLADVYEGMFDADHDPAHLERAAECLQAVADSDAGVITRINALSGLGVTYARLGRHEPEVEAYDRALALEGHVEPATGSSILAGPVRFLSPGRALLLGNQAEGYMALGKLRRAVYGYRAAVRDLPTTWVRDRGVTAMWGLAVALDRTGDLDGALASIAQARLYDPTDQEINRSNWFYVPEYDEHYYAALGHWQHARSPAAAEVRIESYRMAIAAWRTYLDRAPPTDRWVGLAEAHRRACERELERLVSRGAKTPQRPPDPPLGL
jgi:tetratricopeptide (TPR) repeat protein